MITAPQIASNTPSRPRKCRRPDPIPTDLQIPVLEHPNTRSWFGTAHNNALAQAAMIETEDDADTVIGHLTELTLAPMFPLLVEEFRKREAKDQDNPGFNLAQFAARCFFAGTLYTKPSEGVSTR